MRFNAAQQSELNDRHYRQMKAKMTFKVIFEYMVDSALKLYVCQYDEKHN